MRMRSASVARRRRPAAQSRRVRRTPASPAELAADCCFAQPSNAAFGIARASSRRWRLDCSRDLRRGLRSSSGKPGALGEIAALVLAPGAEQSRDAVHAQPVELVDRAQHREPLAGIRPRRRGRSPPSRHRAPCGCSPSRRSCRAESPTPPSCRRSSCRSRHRPPSRRSPPYRRRTA